MQTNTTTNQPNIQSNNTYQNASAPSAPPFIIENHFIDLEEDQIESYMGWSLINNACCLFSGILILFCSIPALIFSMKTNDYIKVGNFNEARNNSRYAFVFNCAGAIFLFLLFLIAIIYIEALKVAMKRLQNSF